MSDDVLRVGIIGVGAIAMVSHVPALLSTKRVKITAICRRREKQLAMAQEKIGAKETYTDWRELLDKAEIDAVLVLTPPDLHTEPTVAALERGLHVFVEKPMALTFRNAWSMVEAARKADRVLTVGFNARYNSKERTIKKVLEEGKIGTVRQVNLALTSYRRFLWTDDPIPEFLGHMASAQSGMPLEFFEGWGMAGDWHTDPIRNGGGTFADIGPHWVSWALWIGGAPPAEVVAFSESAGLSVEGFMNVQARLANTVLLSVSFGDANPGVLGRRALTVIGDLGMLTTDQEGNAWIERGAKQEKLQPNLPDGPPALSFVECVLDDKPNPSPGEDGAYVTAFVEAAYQSAAEGRIIKLSLP